MTPEDLSERLWQFAVPVGRVVDVLPDTRVGRHVAGQLVRCGASAAPNSDEASAAESRADFGHKLGIALKELKETRGWLHFIAIDHLLPARRIAPLYEEGKELSNILGKSISTAKANRRRKDSELPPEDPI